MSWVFVIALAAVVFALLAVLLKAPRASWEVIGAALLLGVAGYAWQGSPDVKGAPKASAEAASSTAEAEKEIAERQKATPGAAMTDKNVVIADAMARHGQFANAAEVLRGAVDRDPNNVDAWLAMANALVGHAEGTISPAAIYAYDQAARVNSANPAPLFFKGFAYIRTGRLKEGRAVWGQLLAQTPADAPWRKDLQMRVVEVDRFLAQQQSEQ